MLSIIDPRTRLAVSNWPDDAPRGSVSTFCLEHGISRKSFYQLRNRAKIEGSAAILEPKSRKPKTSPTRLNDEAKAQALAVRAALEASGLDHGPISVFEKMKSMGLKQIPAIASLARIFRETGVARKEPKKKPRASYRRFVYPAPNACWQLDAAEYVISNGRKRTIYQLIDDHSRLAIASHVATSENAAGALAVVKKGIERYGVPQRLLSDNGVAFNPSRRGHEGQLVKYLQSLGVIPMTGKPGKPSTQGKNERFHQTLFRYLDKQPMAESTEELLKQIEEFDLIYNNERPHQGLPGRITPQAAWAATPLADSPRPNEETTAARVVTPPQLDPNQVTSIRTTKVRKDGTIRVKLIEFRIGKQFVGQTAYVKTTSETIEFFNSGGISLVTCPWPARGINYVGTKELEKYGLSPMS
jgi:transposase InsO family protein